ncbi:MAG: hypothetical protein ABSA76_06635 [Bacteroidales bacterium]
MVLKKYIRILSGTLLFIVFVLLFSCEEIQTLIINCSNCKTDEPTTAEIEIKLSSNDWQTVINIYEGNLEDSILYRSLTTNAESTTCSLPLNKKFTFTARYYKVGGKYYYAVNSTTAHVKYIEDQCDEPCYLVYDNTVNLKLKYTK